MKRTKHLGARGAKRQFHLLAGFFENILIRVDTVNIWLCFGTGGLIMAEYIDREDLVKHLDILYNRLCGKSPYFYCGFRTAVNYVKEFSAADVAPVVRGRWIQYPDCGVTRCSHCGWSIEECWESKRCPECGAKMEGLE